MTLPAVGTRFYEQIWAKPQGVWSEFAETQRDMFLRAAGRVMTLPYGCVKIKCTVGRMINKINPPFSGKNQQSCLTKGRIHGRIGKLMVHGLRV